MTDQPRQQAAAALVARELKLTRPLVLFDLETTGPEPREDRIVEFAGLRITPTDTVDGREVVWTGSAYREVVFRCRPGILIPGSAAAIHGISNEMVAGLPGFGRYAEEVASLIDGADLGGFNVARYDIPLLAAELDRVGLNLNMTGRRVVDVYRIFRRLSPRDLSEAVRRYCGRAHEDAHGARADNAATVEVLAGQLLANPGIPRDVEAAEEWSIDRKPDWLDDEGKVVWRDGEARITFGKHKGRPVREIDRGYWGWLLREDFPEPLKGIAREALAGRYPAGPRETRV